MKREYERNVSQVVFSFIIYFCSLQTNLIVVEEL